MKWSCLNIILAIGLSRGALARRAPFGTSSHSKLQSSNRALSVRGGDLGPVSDKTLAKVLCGAAACDALGGVLAPIESMKAVGVDIEKGSLSEHYLRGIGISATTIAVSLYLAVSGTTSVDEALGWAFATRLASMAIMTVTNSYHEDGHGMVMLVGPAVLMTATIYALFTGNWEPHTLAKLVSVMFGIHGAIMLMSPAKFTKKSTGKGKEDPMTSKLVRADAAYMTLSALVTGLLANGVDPVKVAGYTAVAYIPALIPLLECMAEACSILGVRVEVWTAVIIAMLAAITTGTVLEGSPAPKVDTPVV